VVENVDKMGRKASKNCWNTIWQKARKGDIFFYFSLKTNKLDSDLRDRLFLMKHSCNVAKNIFVNIGCYVFHWTTLLPSLILAIFDVVNKLLCCYVDVFINK